MALWRTNGYAKTTVADICRAAGVSRALFYFYFPAKEDVLFEVGLLSTRAAQKTVRSLLQTDYEVDAVIAEALRSLERSMARNPRELIIETILEGYRHEHRILAGELVDDTDADMFGELFAKAQQDGKLARTCRRAPPVPSRRDARQRRRAALGRGHLRRPLIRRRRQPRHRGLDRRLQPTSRVEERAMKVSVVTAPGETQVVDAPKPTVGPADVLVKIRACGICGTDALFISMGGIPGHDGGMPSPCPSGGRCPSQPKPSDKVLVFGAGPIGLGQF